MNNKVVFLALSIVATYFSFIGIVVDYPFIEPENFNIYKYGRIFWGSINLGLTFLAIFNIISIPKLIPIYLLNMMLYSVHGQFFVPCYYLGYLEIIMFISLLFPVSRKFLYPTVIISGGLLAYIVTISPSSYAESQLLKDKFIYDSIAAIIIISVFSIIAHHSITMVREEKDKLFKKFIDIGKNSSFIIHDLKGMMMYPQSSLLELKYQIEEMELNSSQKKQVLDLLDSSLEEMNLIGSYTKEVTKLTMPKQEQRKETVSLEDLMLSIKTLTYKSLKGINLNYDPSQKIECNPIKVKKILYNIIQNSIEELKSNNVKNPEISVQVKEKSITIKDNGTGFNSKVLKKLNKNKISFVTSKENGSGLGLSVVKELTQESNHSVKFSNDNGAKVQLLLK